MQVMQKRLCVELSRININEHQKMNHTKQYILRKKTYLKQSRSANFQQRLKFNTTLMHTKVLCYTPRALFAYSYHSSSPKPHSHKHTNKNAEMFQERK